MLPNFVCQYMGVFEKDFASATDSALAYPTSQELSDFLYYQNSRSEHLTFTMEFNKYNTSIHSITLAWVTAYRPRLYRKPTDRNTNFKI